MKGGIKSNKSKYGTRKINKYEGKMRQGNKNKTNSLKTDVF